MQSDRFLAARVLAVNFDAVVVLKGAGTIVAAPGRTPRIIGAGNPGMAVGGMGDLLTGAIASMRAQGLDAFDAACCGALLHAAAGDAAAHAGGERGLLPSDLFLTCVASRIRGVRDDAVLAARRRSDRNPGSRAGDIAPGRAVVHLHGDLGSGKSTLARALLRALGVGGAIRSPTYTLVERYPLADGTEALHLDLYRIADAGELEFLGLDAGEGALWMVEWRNVAVPTYPPPTSGSTWRSTGLGARWCWSRAVPPARPGCPRWPATQSCARFLFRA